MLSADLAAAFNLLPLRGRNAIKGAFRVQFNYKSTDTFKDVVIQQIKAPTVEQREWLTTEIKRQWVNYYGEAQWATYFGGQQPDDRESEEEAQPEQHSIVWVTPAENYKPNPRFLNHLTHNPS